MTATPRIYSASSKQRLANREIEVVDMDDRAVYGPELHRLPFKKAVDADMLSDYRVIVLGVRDVPHGVRRSLGRIEAPAKRGQAVTENDLTRVFGVSLAVNGVTEGDDLDRPGQLPRTLAFANSIARSRWYATALKDSEMLRATTRRMTDGRGHEGGRRAS